jgi:hypothetical protein
MGGNVPDATIRLQPAPATANAVFTFGCGTYDGTASCDLGAMDNLSRARELEADLTVPADQSSVQAATLTVIGSAADLIQDPAASATVTLTAPGSTPGAVTTPLPVGSLPDIPFPTPGATLSPGGNAAGLFPTLAPSAGGSVSGDKASVNQVANTSALPESAPVVGAQLLGLAALGLAFLLAVTRLSIRRRPSQPTGTGAAGSDQASPGTPGSDGQSSGAQPSAPGDSPSGPRSSSPPEEH